MEYDINQMYRVKKFKKSDGEATKYGLFSCVMCKDGDIALPIEAEFYFDNLSKMKKDIQEMLTAFSLPIL